ncbi:MAG: hypothetical protein M3081_21680 [Gemmatimonadota bacterium]|nr:hypothetical protein [Gemmatimonadota bacterium]
MSRTSARILRWSLFTLAGAVMWRVATTPLMADDPPDGTVDKASCPSQLDHVTVVDGIWFDNVHYVQRQRVSDDVVVYDVEGSPVSRDGRWRWDNGGAVIQCSIIWLTRHGVKVGLKVYSMWDNWGPLRPISEDSCGDNDKSLEGGSNNDGFGGSSGGCGGGGPDDGSDNNGSGTNCHYETVIIETSNDGGQTWTTLWEGQTKVCQ